MKTNLVTRTLSAAALALLLVACSPATKETKPAASAKTYPLDTCVVTGEKLGAMGKPFTFTHDGRVIKLCCKDCRKDFDKEPSKFLAKLEDAAKAGRVDSRQNVTGVRDRQVFVDS